MQLLKSTAISLLFPLYSPTSSNIRRSAVGMAPPADKFELRDGIVKVTRAGGQDRAAAFFLSAFNEADLDPEEGGLGPVFPTLMDYGSFTHSLLHHFEYDEKKDDLQWTDDTGSLDPSAESPKPTTYVVCGWHSWVTAMIVMQHSQPPAANCLLPIATFTIVKKGTKGTCYFS